MLRRLRFPLLALLTTIIVMLFFGDFLTGREHLEFQDPRSRMTRVIERKYGLSSHDEQKPNAMSEYYFNQLKQKRGDYNWQPAPNSFRIERFTGRRVEINVAIAPVFDLDPTREMYFMNALPTDKIRFAVIQSLFHERATGKDAAAEKTNQQLMTQEKDRMESVLRWVEVDSKNPAISLLRWWRDNAAIFGLTPEGDPLPASTAVLLKQER